MHYLWTTLHVRDMEKSLAFYRDLLGMRVDSRGGESPEIAMLGPEGGPMLELLRPTPFANQPPLGSGVAIGYRVTDLDTRLERIRATGASVSEILTLRTMRFAFATDPDGYQVQLVERL